MGNDFGKRPALQFRERASLDDADAVTDLALVAFVMHIIFFRALDDLVEFRVRNTGNVLNDESLVHFIGDDHADAGFTKVDLCVRRRLAHGSNRWDLGLSERLGGDRSEHSRSFATHLADAGRIFQSAGGALETEIKSFLLEFQETSFELGGGKFAGSFGFGFGHVFGQILDGIDRTDQACGLRATRRVRMPSL